MFSGKECLLLKHGDLSLDPKHPCKKPSVAVCVSITQALGVGTEAGGSLVLAGCQPSSRFRERPCFKEKGREIGHRERCG